MSQAERQKRHVGLLVLAVIGMFGFGFALVPLYEVFCDITGLNGKTASEPVSVQQGMTVDTSRLVTIEFIGHVNPGMPWRFEPVVRRMQLHPGQVHQVDYRAVSLAASDTAGQAVPSVSPGQAARYLNKIECFCFNRQDLAGGATLDMPVQFYIDPDLPEEITTLTLSYTLFNVTDS